MEIRKEVEIQMLKCDNCEREILDDETYHKDMFGFVECDNCYDGWSDEV